MDDTFFWILWGVTLGLCGWKILEGFRRPERMLEWPFIACTIWAYFYGYMAYEVKTLFSDYLPPGSFTLGALMPLLCLVGILWGWKLGMAGAASLQTQRRDYSLLQVWWVGVGLLLVGVIGSNVFSGFTDIAVNFENASGYSYLSFFVGYPGLTLAVWAASKMSSGHRRLCWAMTVVGIVAFMYPFLFGGRRGPLFPTAMVLLMLPALANRRAPNPLVFFTGLILAGLLMLLCLQIRTTRSYTRSWSEVISSLDITNAVQDRGREATDNEYLNNCALIAAARQSGKYQYGSGHAGLLLHWIPRAWWPNKPALGEGLYSHQEMFDEVESIAGIRLIGGGAAAGGVADSYTQYGYFTPLFWFGLSWCIAKTFGSAKWGNDPRWLWAYAGIVCVSHWLISQGAAAAFVPGVVFVIVPLVASIVFRRIPHRTVPSPPTARP